MPSVLWRCWMGGRKGIRPVKTEWWGAGMVVCLERDADLHMAQLMPLPLTVSCFSKIQIGFTFLVPVHPGSPGQRAVKRVCVCYLQNWFARCRRLVAQPGGLTLSFALHLVHFCSSLPVDTRLQTDDCFVTRPRSSSRGHNTNMAVTVAANIHCIHMGQWRVCDLRRLMIMACICTTASSSPSPVTAHAEWTDHGRPASTSANPSSRAISPALRLPGRSDLLARTLMGTPSVAGQRAVRCSSSLASSSRSTSLLSTTNTMPSVVRVYDCHSGRTLQHITARHVTNWLMSAHVGWRRGVVVSGVRRMNEVNARRARLVPGWVTVFGLVYRIGM